MITMWVLVIVAITRGGYGAGMVTIPNFPTAASCIAAEAYARAHYTTGDTYCVAVPVPKKH